MESLSELETALRIAWETGDILTSYFESDRIDIRAKGSRDVVTAADIAAELHVLTRLQEAFPGDGIMAEEGTEVATSTGRTWYLDPLDGTMNYSRGIPLWCVSLAVFDGSGPVIGVIFDPVSRETFASDRGLGATLNGRPIRCARPTSLSNAFVHVTVDFNDASMLEGLDDIRVVAPHVMRTRNIGSAALALAYVACGRFDAMLHRSAHVWDYAAGVALVQEAGGIVTDMAGLSFTPSTVSMVAGSSTRVHADLLNLIRAPAHARIQ